MKKILAILGMVFFLLIVGIGALITYFSIIGTKLDRESKESAGTIINSIGANWKPETVFAISIPEMESDTTLRNQVAVILNSIENTLGPLQKFENLNGQSKMRINQNGKTIWAEYTAQIFCKNDSGTISITLDFSNKRWMLRRFHVNSNAFLTKMIK